MLSLVRLWYVFLAFCIWHCCPSEPWCTIKLTWPVKAMCWSCFVVCGHNCMVVMFFFSNISAEKCRCSRYADENVATSWKNETFFGIKVCILICSTRVPVLTYTQYKQWQGYGGITVYVRHNQCGDHNGPITVLRRKAPHHWSFSTLCPVFLLSCQLVATVCPSLSLAILGVYFC